MNKLVWNFEKCLGAEELGSSDNDNFRVGLNLPTDRNDDTSSIFEFIDV
jgi:hypothetical protein